MGAELAALMTSAGQTATSALGGVAAYRAGSFESKMLKQQGDAQFQDQVTNAEVRAREIRLLMGRQANTYSASGVTLEGSPLAVIEETRKIGQKEINSLIQRGQTLRTSSYLQASQAKNRGLSDLIGGLFKSSTSAIEATGAYSKWGAKSNSSSGNQAQNNAMSPNTGGYDLS